MSKNIIEYQNSGELIPELLVTFCKNDSFHFGFNPFAHHSAHR